ncbi:MAG: hypothetical protein AB7F64_07225 [Gammaproteobacteria bacterium]
MKQLLKYTFFGFLIIWAGFASASQQNKHHIRLMFVQTAGKVSIQPLAGHKNTYTITLRQMNPYVTYFSNRPYRVAGMLTVQNFINRWNQGKGPANFNQNPPNASLVALKSKFLEKSQSINFALEVSHPQYNRAQQSLTYTIHALKGGKQIPVGNFNHVGLFIDAFMGGPCPSCIING